MAGGSKSGGRPSGSGIRGYTLRGRNGKINYVGTTNIPGRRAGEHKSEGKSGRLQTETRPMSRGGGGAVGSRPAQDVPGQSRRKEPTSKQNRTRIVDTGRRVPRFRCPACINVEPGSTIIDRASGKVIWTDFGYQQRICSIGVVCVQLGSLFSNFQLERGRLGPSWANVEISFGQSDQDAAW